MHFRKALSTSLDALINTFRIPADLLLGEVSPGVYAIDAARADEFARRMRQVDSWSNDPKEKREFLGLSIPLHRRQTVCVSRRRDPCTGVWREVRRYNAWRKDDDLNVVPPVQDALAPIPA